MAKEAKALMGWSVKESFLFKELEKRKEKKMDILTFISELVNIHT